MKCGDREMLLGKYGDNSVHKKNVLKVQFQSKTQEVKSENYRLYC